MLRDLKTLTKIKITMNRNLIKPDTVDQTTKYSTSVFLAGSIEMGSAEEWQTEITDKFLSHMPVDFFNPRRSNWDSSWTGSDPRFIDQVNWELDHLLQADLIFFYFSPDTYSPISLLELGNQLGRLGADAVDKIIVCCPEGYWRKGNVQIICDRYNVPVFNSFSNSVAALRDAINRLNR